MEKNLQKNIYMCIYIYMNEPLCCISKTYKMVNQLYFNKKRKFFSILKLDKLTGKLQETSLIKNYKKKI